MNLRFSAIKLLSIAESRIPASKTNQDSFFHTCFILSSFILSFPMCEKSPNKRRVPFGVTALLGALTLATDTYRCRWYMPSSVGETVLPWDRHVEKAEPYVAMHSFLYLLVSAVMLKIKKGRGTGPNSSSPLSNLPVELHFYE